MRCFLTLFWLECKSLVKSAVFWVATVFFLVLVLVLAAVLPQGRQAGLCIGVLPQTDIARQAAQNLAENGDYQVIVYAPQEEAQMRRDIMTGALHCGYLLSDEWHSETPITLFKTDAAYLDILTNQLVSSAYFTAKMPRLAAEYLKNLKLDDQSIADEIKRQRASSRPFTVELRSAGGGASVQRLAENSMQPLIYTVLVSVYTLTALLSALLRGTKKTAALRQFSVLSGRRFCASAAPAAAAVTLHFAVLLAADTALGFFMQGQVYAAPGRLSMLLLLACFAAVLSMAASALRRFSMGISILAVPLFFIWIFCSGALVNPAQLPMGLGTLRFLSPAWYALQWMGLFG